jgi:hypothetical protein
MALVLPAAYEKASHGSPSFFVESGKAFAYYSADQHGDGKFALLARISGRDEQAQLIELDSVRYYRPPYYGDGWNGIRLACPAPTGTTFAAGWSGAGGRARPGNWRCWTSPARPRRPRTCRPHLPGRKSRHNNVHPATSRTARYQALASQSISSILLYVSA